MWNNFFFSKFKFNIKIKTGKIANKPNQHVL